jgi:hypothetical protein
MRYSVLRTGAQTTLEMIDAFGNEFMRVIAVLLIDQERQLLGTISLTMYVNSSRF